MPASPFYHREADRDAATITLAASDMSLRDHSPMYNSYDDRIRFEPMISEPDPMIFGLDLDDLQHEQPKSPFPWDAPSMMHYSNPAMSSIPFPGSPDSTTSQLDQTLPAHTRRFDSTFSNSSGYFPPSSPEFNESALYSNWITDPDGGAHGSSSLPIPIPAGHAQPAQSSMSSSFAAAFSENSSIFPDVSPFSPTTAYAALQPLPLSPPEDTVMTEQLRIDPAGPLPPHANMYVGVGVEPPAPAWASQLWDHPHAPTTTTGAPTGMPMGIAPLTDDNFATQRPRMPFRRGTPVSQLFQSSSAPSVSHARSPSLTHAQARPYATRRSESISEYDDRDGTVRKKRRPAEDEDESLASGREKRSESRECFFHSVRAFPRDTEHVMAAPLKSVLRPPKLAPSAWQLYFTDWIQRHQASSHKKLNVAQAAKEAGQEYARLSPAQKEVCLSR